MHVNISVVKALMALRGISESMLSNLAHCTEANLATWLHDIGEDSEEKVPFDTQLEILRFLGINGDAPRNDVVHYWRVHEPFFSNPNNSYWALQVMLKAFGKAQCVYLARESDPIFTLRARSRFGLKFSSFTAILDVTAHPLRAISFDPDQMVDLSWMPDAAGVLLPALEYDSLQPGAMQVPRMREYLCYSTELAQWERLREAVSAQGFSAQQVASLLLGTGDSMLKLALSPEAEAEVAPEPVEVAEYATPTPTAQPPMPAIEETTARRDEGAPAGGSRPKKPVRVAASTAVVPDGLFRQKAA